MVLNPSCALQPPRELCKPPKSKLKIVLRQIKPSSPGGGALVPGRFQSFPGDDHYAARAEDDLFSHKVLLYNTSKQFSFIGLLPDQLH